MNKHFRSTLRDYEIMQLENLTQQVETAQENLTHALKTVQQDSMGDYSSSDVVVYAWEVVILSDMIKRVIER